MDYNRVQAKRKARKAARHDERLAHKVFHQNVLMQPPPSNDPYESFHTNLQGLSGLGQSDTQPIEQGISAVAQFVPIPGFGQVVSAVESILNTVFGWGDPTPIEDLYSKVIQLRVQLADVNHQMGIPDDFHIPPGVTTNTNGGGWNVLALFIVNDYLHGVPSETLADDVDWNYEHVHGQELINHYNPEVRDDLYKTIKLLANAITDAMGQQAPPGAAYAIDAAASGTPAPAPVSEQMLPPPPPQDATTSQVVSNATDGATSPTPASGIDWTADMPYILFGAGFLLLLMMAGKKSN